ncbi:MAG: GGDEF domain-containing protein [Betaproteobacteria bacterium]|nr:GGDEF domain-containing protein [Betaproteobacteria bacterium]MDH3435689.1 GGDEF domain-containing protein [Betaproteobacteria bacterium]
MPALLGGLALLTVPAAVLVAAFLFVVYSPALPRSLAGLELYGPYILFAIGSALALTFKRGRVLAALAVLIIAYIAQQLWLQHGLVDLSARTIFLALGLFVPLNLGVLAFRPERGTLNRYGALRLAVLAAEAALAAWIIQSGGTGIIDAAYLKFIDPAPISAGHLPQLAILFIALGALAALAATFLTRSAINASLAGAIIAFAVAAHVVTASTIFSVFITAAELMVTIGVLQASFRMAFRDELTGLPSRRALNERLMTLPRAYTIAMLDIDHFKKFNDTYGHDLGDHVLKMIAARIARISGGGTAFRYGGEEFTVLFPGKSIGEAVPFLEALRENVQAYQLALRASDRPKKSKGAKRQRGGWRDKRSVSVTISIGVAERNDRLETPEEVTQAADRALYRAKEKGRNQVSR